MEELRLRYNRAKEDNLKAFRYSLHLRMVVVEGMLNTYTDYAHQRADRVSELRLELFGDTLELDTDSDSDSE
jgi:hypothetical protein